MIRTRDGLRLAGEDHVPPGARAHVVIVHGFGEHAGRYGHVVAALNAAGYACHTFDLRGHGASAGRRGDGRFDDFRDDLDLVIARARSMAGARRLVVLGHSMGGLIALDHVLHRPGAFAGLAVTSPFLGVPFRVSAIQRVALAVLGCVAPAMSLPARVDSRWLSHDPDVARAYADDARVLSHLTVRLWNELRAAQQALRERAHEVRIPALFQVSGNDRVVDAAATYDVYARLGSADKRLLTYDGYFHELFNEVDRATVLEDLRRWLDAHAA